MNVTTDKRHDYQFKGYNIRHDIMRQHKFEYHHVFTVVCGGQTEESPPTLTELIQEYLPKYQHRVASRSMEVLSPTTLAYTAVVKPEWKLR